MNFATSRRAFIGGTAATGLLLPARAALAHLWPASGFTHSVASGDPGADAITLWTRYVAANGKAARLHYEVAADEGFGRILKRGEATASPDHDWCVRPRVSGLPSGGWAFYRFIAADGTKSPAGRTRTLPQGKLDRFNIAVFSCANKPFGWFNAYAHAAARTDIDLVVHLGDYLYEYKLGNYPEQPMADRQIEPASEIVHLDDYRQRYASYRVDPALQELHRRFPMISIWDDHEFANDTWKGGAENHQPKTEGPWEARRKAAMRAYFEWLPAHDPITKSYDIGDLLSLITLDTRVAGRDHQLDLGGALKSGGLAAFHDGAWSDQHRTLMGFGQEAWAAKALRDSVKSGRKWQLGAQQIVMGNLLTPKETLSWLGPDASARAKAYVGGGIAAAAAGISGNMDSWGGYVPARSRFLKAAQDADAELVVISGDSHNAWAFDLAEGGKAAGVEFGGQSVTSPGYEEALVANPAVVRDGLVARNSELKWCDTSRRGYMAVAFTPENVRCDWVFMQTVRNQSLATGPGQSATVARGRRQMALV